MIAGRVVFSFLLCNNSPGEGNLLSTELALICSAVLRPSSGLHHHHHTYSIDF